MGSRPVPLAVLLAVCATLLGTALAMTWYGLALAGDGSYYLVRILGTENVFGPDFRVFANAVRQAPVLASAAVGVTDTHTLTLMHGGGQLVVPAVVWSLAIVLTRSDRLAFSAVTMTAALCAASTWFFSVSESVLSLPLTVTVAALLWLPREWRWGDIMLAVAASLVLVASYETTLLTGAVLATWAVVRSRRQSTRRSRYASAFVALAAVLSMLAAIGGVNAGPGPTNAQSFMYFVLSLEPRPFYAGLAGITALVLAMVVAPGKLRWLLLAAGAVALGAGMLAADTTTGAAFEGRGGAAIAGLLTVLFLGSQWLLRERTAARAQTPAWFLAAPVALMAVACVVSVSEARSWHTSLEAFRAEVDATRGVATAAETLPANQRDALWDWTAASLSLIVRSRADAGILVDENPSYVPFLPSAAREQLSDEFVWRR